MDDMQENEEKLRAVFNLCDPQAKGYVTVDSFLELCKEHFGTEESDEQELQQLIKVLDPQNDCKIYFDDFCKGVQKIAEIHAHSNSISSSQRARHGSEETLIDQPLGSQETLLADDDGAHDTSHNTFSEYDMLTDEDNNIAANNYYNRKYGGVPAAVIRPASDDECDSAISGPSSRRGQSSITDDEEHFEGFGEDDISSEASDIPYDCRLKSSPHNSPTVGKIARLSTATTAKPPAHPNKGNLFRPASSNNSRRSSLSEEVFDDIDCNFLQLNDKVKRLEQQLEGLSNTQTKSDDRHVRLKEENLFLEDRVHVLEESLMDIQSKAKDNLEMEQKKHRDYIDKQERLLNREIEGLTLRLHSVENEYLGLKDEAPRLQAELEILRRDKKRLEEKLSESQDMLKVTATDYETLQDEFKQQAVNFERERELNAELLDELSKELDDLRRFRNEAGGRSRSASVTSVYKDLESEMQKLRQENITLREQNEDLHGTLMNNHVEEGRTLLHSDKTAKSFAQEMDEMTRDQIMEALIEQREVNFKLREYIDRIILTIVEKNPSLLEITNRRTPGLTKTS
ncbi:rab11 family-interacting protein 4B-like isoform X2 [Tubulanus polymorphus]|uniref:rab11 family-interacting protein 4B-like isoform X2 n=1 Tax=Tubulanus polymorphus TaxID=672921 RepID=UPI003DA52EFA